MATPSLAMIPSAIADSKVYSVLPNNGDGDFTFNRDSAATRIGSNGLIQTVGYFGNDLVTNGDFATDSDWTKQAGWTISGGTANSDGTANNALNQYLSIPTGTLRIKFDVTARTQGTVRLFIDKPVFTELIEVSAISSYEVDVVTTSNTGRIWFYSTSNFIGSIDNVSVQQILGDQPRLNYDISNGVVQSCPSLLLEPASTNLVLNSTTGAYGNSPGSELITAAPDGTNTAIIPVPDSSSDRYQYVITGGTYATGTNLTYSWYSKQISTPILTYVGNLAPQILINATQVGSTIKVKDSINGWAKYSATFSITVGSLPSTIRLYFGSVIGIGNQSVAYWGHQLEALPYCTSLIPTYGAIQTRAAETCNDAGTASTFSDSEGVLYAEIAALSNTADSSKFITISDGTYNNRASILFSSGSTNQIRTFLRVGGVSQIDVSDNVADVTDFNKIAFSYKQNDFKVYINGSLVSSDTSGSVWSANTITTLSFSEINTSAGKFNGKCKDIRVYNEALTDAQLQTLTTL